MQIDDYPNAPAPVRPYADTEVMDSGVPREPGHGGSRVANAVTAARYESQQVRPGASSRRSTRLAGSPAGVGRTLQAPLLKTKLSPPAARPGLVRRTDLLELIRQSDAPLVSVCAPAGYGKTTLLGQLAETTHAPLAWVSLDSSDQDPVHLLAELATALEELLPIDPSVVAALQSGDASLQTDVLPRLLNSLTQTRECLVVLDDVDRAANGPSGDLIAYLCEHLPPGVRLVLACRTVQSLPVGRLRARRLLLELGPNELSLSPAQARAVFEAACPPVSADALDALYSQTEGWPAGVYLAALAARGSADPDLTTREFDGADATVVEYLTTEILEPQVDEHRQFLERTSVLERFSAPLCDAVLGRNDSAVILAAMEQSNGFVVALDRRRQWYAYHPLFRQTLRAAMARHDPGRPVEIHLRAAEWYEAAGDVPAAIDQALAAGDERHVARLLLRHLRALFDETAGLTLLRWVQSLSDATLSEHPSLALAGAWTTFSLGDVDLTQRYLRLAEQAPPAHDERPPFDESSRESALTLLRGTLAWGGVSSMNHLADSVRAVEPPGSPAYRIAGLCLGASLFLHERSGAAVGPLRDAAESDAHTTDVALLAHALLALVDLEERRPADADDALRDAFDLSLNGTPHGPAAAPLYAAQAWLAVLRDDHLSARVFLDQAIAGLRCTCVMPWLCIYVHIVLGRVALELDDPIRGAAMLEGARRSLARYPDAGVLPHMLAKAEHALELARGGGRLLLEPLTQAELRVLELAPTYLSVEEIGRELCVSRNTVKSHLKAIYGKLNVASRSEAVQRARALRLIERADG